MKQHSRTRPTTPARRGNLLLTCCLLVTSLASVACGAQRERPGTQPHSVLLVTVAGLRADHTSMLLYPLPTTDRAVDGGQRAFGRALGLDDLAAEGVLFASAFAPSSDPLISLGALHTGRSPVETRILGRGSEPAEDEQCLAESLQARGFETVAFLTHQQERLGPGWQQGFDQFLQFEDDLATLGALITWVGTQDFGRGKPLLLWLHLEGPRFPFEPGALPAPGGVLDFAHQFTDPGYDGPARGDSEFREQVRSGELEVDLSRADRQHLLALYDGEVAQVTELLYRYFDILRYESGPAGLWDRSLVVVAGTGGPRLPRRDEQRDWGGETSLNDEVLRVPLFLRHPDSITGRRIFSTPVELMDLGPTLCELFDAPVDERVQGRSLLALVDSYVEREFPERPLFAVAPGEVGTSVRSEGWRLVRRRGGRERLIHAAIDPLSMRDESKEELDRLARMRALLDAWDAQLP